MKRVLSFTVVFAGLALISPFAVTGPRLFTPSHSCARYAWACRARTGM